MKVYCIKTCSAVDIQSPLHETARVMFVRCPLTFTSCTAHSSARSVSTLPLQHDRCQCSFCVFATVSLFLCTVLFSSPLLSLFSCRACGQAYERQKEYFDCIRNERDELRDELADLKGKSRMGEVRLVCGLISD